MKKLNLILLSVGAIFALTGCNDGPTGEKITYSKSSQEVYEQSCKKCHGDNGEGNTEKKSPALNDRQAGELELDLYDVKNGGTNQSSGTDHDIMEHNMKKLIDKGYDYDPKDMALYIEKNFYNKNPATETSAPVTEEVPVTEAETPTPVVEAVPVTAEATPATEATPAEAAPAN